MVPCLNETLKQRKFFYKIILVLVIYQLRWDNIQNLSMGGLNARDVAKYVDSRPIEGCISEMVQDIR